jgi:hypothetical protein
LQYSHAFYGAAERCDVELIFRACRGDGCGYNSRMRAVIRSTVATSAGVLLVALAWAAARFYAWEPIDVPRHSWAYTFKVSNIAKEFKLWAPRSAPLYDVARSRGRQSDYTLIRYTAGLSLRELQPRIEADGLACQYYGTHALVCDRSRGRVLEAQVSAREIADHVTELTVQVQDR